MKINHSVIRYSILIFFLLLFSAFALLHQFEGRPYASVDALCPFGGIETLYTFIMSGGFVPGILISSLILTIGVLLTVILFKRSFCGYICPFGTIQELLGKIIKYKINVPEKVDKVFRYIKYVVLAVILIATAYTGILIFRSYDPFISFFHFGKGILWGTFEESALIGFVILIVTLILSVFIERAWCKYFCPLGAVMAIFSKLGLTKIKRDEKTCINCKLCDKVCPVKVNVSNVNYVKSVECINCNICVSKCPKKSLSLTTAGKKISVNTYVVLTIALLFLVVLASVLFGFWQSVPNTNIADASGNVNPLNIKGWMTIEEVSNSTKIPVGCFIHDLGLPASLDPKTPLNQISSAYNISFEAESVREFVANYQANVTVVEDKANCPWNIVNDSYPGKCGLYVDANGNTICDYS